jgi:lysozyme family protein
MAASEIIDRILDREGAAYTNRSADKGGPTKYGITLETLRRWRGATATAADVAALTEGEARKIYQNDYIDAPGFWRIANPYLQELVVDCGVNHGQGRAARWLQLAAGVPVDGIVGVRTAQVVNAGNARELFAEVLATRNSFYEDLDDIDHGQEANEDGWVNRVNGFIRMLARMPAEV